MGKYNQQTEWRITRIIKESVVSKNKSHYRPLQPKAKAIGVKQARNRVGFEELQGE